MLPLTLVLLDSSTMYADTCYVEDAGIRHAVTGTGSFTGRYIAQRLLDAGHEVIGLSRRPAARHPLTSRVTSRPFNFDRPRALADSLRGVDTLYNTYWIRFARGRTTFDQAVRNTATLVEAAREAGVRRIVHLSVVNATDAPEIPYFAAKARAEELVAQSGISCAIVRPTLTYGDDDILVNNLAWTLRRFPVFGMPGSGRGRLQPVYVDDVAELAVRLGPGITNVTVDAAGPEVYTLREFVEVIRRSVGSRAVVVPMPVPLALVASGVIGVFVRDVVLTPDEVTELEASLLASKGPPTGATSFSAWVAERGSRLGRRWSSELARNYAPA